MTILDLVRRDDLAHDPWGTSMSWLFSIAETLSLCGPVPPAWGYRQALGGVEVNDATLELRRLLDDGIITENDLRRAGKALHRYLHICELTGKSY